MLSRIPLILFGIPAVYGLLVSAGDIARLVFLIIVCLVGQFELSNMISKDFKFKPFPEFLAGITILSCAHFFGERGLLFSFIFSVIFLVIFTVLRGLNGSGYKRFTLGIFSLFYLPLCLGFFLLIATKLGGQHLFVILASIWALDTGAYLFGMSIKGPKLAPKISPNKTIAGAIGGGIACISFFAIMHHYSILKLPFDRLFILALSVATIGQIADLFESVLKREFEIKDSGSILGAHGGILDRIDSILFLGPVCYALFVI